MRRNKKKIAISENYTEDSIEKSPKQTKHKFDLTENKFNLRHISPRTDKQKDAFKSYFNENHLLLTGCAGTGKTFIALYLALNDLFKDRIKKIIILRSAVSTKDQGFLPGTLEEKMKVYELPYKDIVEDLISRGDGYEILKKKRKIEFMSTSFLRGLTFDDTIIIVDEAQNCSFHELSSILTRVGKNTKIMLVGDTKQDDLLGNKKNKEVSGLSDMIKVASEMSYFDIVDFTVNDIVRSDFVKEFLIVKNNLNID